VKFALISEYIPKRNLWAILHPDKDVPGLRVETILKLSIHRKLEIIHQIAEGMQALHKIDVIHGNLKPSNILLDEDFNVKIADYGFPALREVKFEAVKKQSSILYAAPEILKDFVITPTKEGDVYAFGVLVYEIYTENNIYDAYVKQEVSFEPKITKKVTADDPATEKEEEKLIKEFQKNKRNLISALPLPRNWMLLN